MKICGLVAEYNPFHNGHLYHIEEAKKVTKADFIVVVMSGNFVQRGTPAIIDKIERTRMALDAGADVVFELPTLFATSSAEVFATAAVNLLDQLGAVDCFCFGSECGNLQVLEEIADVLNNEPETFSASLRNYLKQGYHYAKARALALSEYFRNDIPDLDEILLQSNSILGIEYLRALKHLNSSMKPYTILRSTSEYNSTEIVGNMASAMALRKQLIEHGDTDLITNFVPQNVLNAFEMNIGITTPISAEDFSGLLQYKLMQEKNHLTDYLDFSKELADRVNNLLPDLFTFREWAGALKTKTYTETRIHRALLHAILEMKESDLEAYKQDDFCLYAKLLGFKKDSAACLKALHDSTSLPIISKMADAKKKLDERAFKLLEFDINATNIYRSVVFNKFHTVIKDEFTAGIVKR